MKSGNATKDKCTGKQKVPQRKEVDHQRHHSFMKNPLPYVNENRRKHAFGAHYFKTSASEHLGSQLIKDLLFRARDEKDSILDIPAMMVRHVRKGSTLWKILMHYRFLGIDYIHHVITKECVIFMMMLKMGSPYEKVNDECTNTEIDLHQYVKQYRSTVR